MKTLLEPLADSDALEVRDRLLAKFLADQDNFDLSALSARGWTALPFPERIGEWQADLIAAEAARRGVMYGISVTTSLKAKVEANRVRLNADGILQFDANCMLRSFLLVLEDESFAILEEGDLFYVIAGSRDIVSRIAGNSLEGAREKFCIYANDSGWPDAIRDWLVKVSDQYTYL